MLHGILFGFIAVVNTVLVAAIIALWFRCVPLAKEWDDSVEGTCWSLAVHEAIGIAAQSELSFLPHTSKQNDRVGYGMVWHDADVSFGLGFSGAMDIVLVAIGLALVWPTDLSVGQKAAVLSLSMLGIV